MYIATIINWNKSYILFIYFNDIITNYYIINFIFFRGMDKLQTFRKRIPMQIHWILYNRKSCQTMRFVPESRLAWKSI